MVVLPDGEEILDVVCGHRDFWVISAADNIAHVKPVTRTTTAPSARVFAADANKWKRGS